ncbi:MAG: serine/threonine-protein kinase [Planctomycetes bacterium]|nr:serine/threonine-protein kinase [Planctomycetota bacterium]
MTRIDKMKELFHLALEKDAGVRAAFVERACGGDAKLREDVMDLLRLHEGVEERQSPAEPGESAGDCLGPYKLLQPIGSGGFGVVWMAEQQRPVRRKVALKIIKLGMDTKQVVARFEAERQALAMMDHENIAKVFDAGTTERGRPYFVMELVKGVPITEYCDQAQLPTAERLELFQHVCHAVQHAHHKGIIHRDLKPSNVLVTLHDGRPVPKVIDFGVAKATDHRLTERTLFTEFRQIVGTPEYMSPEQAEFSGLDIDTRSDVYSLGVLLYELLTGTKPFDMRALLEKGFDEMLRHIREVDPPKPSTRVSTLGEAGTGIAQQRRTAPRLLGRLLRGDLDWICMRALEKERTRRYGTASDFAADIGRYLLDLPIEARPPSATYRAAKFVRRHRAAVAAAAAVFVALLGGLVAAGLGWREAEAQREAAGASAREARTEASRARTVIGLLEGMLVAGDPHAAKGADYTVRELLDEFSGGLRGQLEDEPEVAANLHQIVANAYGHLGLLDKADRHQEIALELRRRHLGAMHPRTLESEAARAWRLHDRAKYVEAERVLREIRPKIENIPLEDPALDILDYSLADMLRHQAKHEEAREAAERSLTRRHARAASAIDISECMRLLARIASDAGDLPRAEALCREALARERESLGPDHPRVAVTLHDLGLLRARSFQYEEAVQLYREANEINRTHLGREEPSVLGTLGSALGRLERTREAEEAFLRAIELSRELGRGSHPETAHIISSLGSFRFNLCAYGEAEKCYREALAIRRAVFAPDHPSIAKALEDTAEALERQGRHAEMEPLLEEALRIRRNASGEEWARCEALGLLAVAYAAQGRLEEAEKLAREGVELARGIPGDSEQTFRSLDHLRRVLWSKGECGEAIELSREILAFWRGRCGEKNARTAISWNNLGFALHEVRDTEGAEAAYRQSIAIWQEISPDHAEKAAGLNNLGLLLKERGELEEAERSFREACRIGQEARSGDDVARYRFHLGLVLELQGRVAEAESEMRAALAFLREHAPGRPRTFEMWESLGRLLVPTRPADAVTVFAEAVAAARDAFGPDAPRTLKLASCHAWALRESGRAEDGERILRASLETAVRVHGGDSGDVQVCRIELAHLIALELGRWAEAEALLRSAMAHLRRSGASLEDVDLPLDLLIRCLLEQGKPAEAEPFARELLAARRKHLGDGHRATLAAWHLLGTGVLASRPEEAAAVLAEACESTRAALGPDHAQTLGLASCHAWALSECGRTAESERTLRAVLETATRARGEDTDEATRYRLELADQLLQQRRHGEADPLLRRSLEGLRRAADPDLPWALELLAASLTDQGKGAEAEAFARELLEARRAAPADRAALARSLVLLGRSLIGQGRYAEAEGALVECLEIRRKTMPEGSWLIASAMSILGECLAGLGKNAEAEVLLVQGRWNASWPSTRRREGPSRPPTGARRPESSTAARTAAGSAIFRAVARWGPAAGLPIEPACTWPWARSAV